MTYSWTVTPWIGDVEHADHELDARGQLLRQYERSTRLQAFISGFLDQIQSLEDLAVDVIAMRSVYTAEGVQLDVLGDIVNQERAGLSDDAYRIFLLGKIYANLSDGEIEQINELLADVLGYETVSVRELWPCALEIYADGVTYPEVVNRLLKLMVAGGVYYSFDFSAVAESSTFTFSSVVNTEETDANQGMGSMDSETADGGEISGSLGRF